MESRSQDKGKEENRNLKNLLDLNIKMILSLINLFSVSLIYLHLLNFVYRVLLVLKAFQETLVPMVSLYVYIRL